MSRVSPAHRPATRLRTTATRRPPRSGRKTGVSSRQKNSAERYHIGQCGSRKRSSSCSPPTYTRNRASAVSKRTYGTTTVRTSATSRAGDQANDRDR